VQTVDAALPAHPSRNARQSLAVTSFTRTSPGIGALTLAGVTLLTATVAAFQEPLRRHFTRAKLAMEIRLTPPDATQIQGTNPQTGAFISQQLYLRIRVSHVGGKAAENAEILPSMLWRKAADGSWEVVKSFLPLSLAWSHIRTPTIRVPVGLFRHCDLGNFRPDGQGGVVFLFDTFVQPNPVAGGFPPNLILPGAYRVDLMLTSDNTKPVIRTWELTFDGPWSDDEQTLLSQVDLVAI
jgi:hypothetical protein